MDHLNWMKKVSVCEMLKYGIEFYELVYEGAPRPIICVVSPASAYLFGDHSDYNGGFALSVTLPLFLMILIGYNNDKLINIASEAACGKKLVESFSILQVRRHLDGMPDWVKIPLTVALTFKDKLNKGMNIAYVSSIPMGIGLGSSTAMAAATFTAFTTLTKSSFKEQKMIKIFRNVEMHITNTRCGYAQSMVSLYGQPEHVYMMDCNTLTGNHIPIDNFSAVFILTYSGNERLVPQTDFKQRVEECDKAAELLGLKSLSEATSDLLRSKKALLKPTLLKRVTHIVEENIRAHEAALAFRKKDYLTLGLKMLQSHYSLKNNFEVSIKDLDDLVSLAMACPGVYGSKLTGIGWGGCTITLIDEEKLSDFVDLIDINYSGECTFFVVRPWVSTTEMSFALAKYYSKIDKRQSKDLKKAEEPEKKPEPVKKHDVRRKSVTPAISFELDISEKSTEDSLFD